MIQLVLVHASESTGTDGRTYRHEDWNVIGGSGIPTWRRPLGKGRASWERRRHFALTVVDGEVGHLVGFDDVLWPLEWPALFRTVTVGRHRNAVEITDVGLMLRATTLCGTSDTCAREASS